MAYALETLTIATSGTTSGSIDPSGAPQRRLTIGAPATLAETVTVEVDQDGSGTFRDLYSGDAAVTVPAGATRIVDASSFEAVRLVSSSAVAADRAFSVRLD